MKKLILLAATILAFISNASAFYKIDLSGRWTLDKEKSQAVRLGIDDQIFVITMTPSSVKLENHVFAGPGGEVVLNDEFLISQKKENFVWKRAGGQEGNGKRAAKWSDDGKSLLIDQDALFDGAAGPVTYQQNQSWSLSDDSNTLIVDTTLNILPFNTVPFKNFYHRVK